MRPYDLVLQPEVEQVHHLLILRALVGEQVLHRVHVVGVPLQLQALGVALGSPKGYLCILFPKHAAIEKVIDAFVVDLHETYIHSDFAFGISGSHTGYFLQE